MKKFDSTLILSDIDGTVCWNGAAISPRNADAIRYFTENGGHFSFSSGRNHRDIYFVLPTLKELANMPCILCNGSYLYDAQTGEILNPHYLEKEYTIHLLAQVRERFPKAGFRVTTPDGFLVPENDAVMMRQLAEWGIADLATIRKQSEFDGVRWFKAVFLSDALTLSHVADYIRTHYGDHFALARSGPTLLELQPFGVSKGYQIPFLRERYPNSRLFAIGDLDNDAEMLRCADVAACPENASDEIKKIASVHVCHCRDGAVADLIERIEKHDAFPCGRL